MSYLDQREIDEAEHLHEQGMIRQEEYDQADREHQTMCEKRMMD